MSRRTPPTKPPTQERAWPTHVNRDRLESDARLELAQTHLDEALDSVAHQRLPSVIEADLLRVARQLADVRRLLQQAGQGKPDTLGVALDLIEAMLHEGVEPHRARAAAFLARYREPPRLTLLRRSAND